MRAGYVGVDAFFVVSGFLITGLLLKECSAKGRVNLGDFYARRAKRLLPASAVVLIATAALTLAFVPRLRWRAIAGDGFASALYFANWRLASGSVDYLLEEAAPSPLQHYWSLAVEEQFYFVWPVVVILLTPAMSQRAGLLKPRLMLGIGVILVASFAWSVYYSATSPGPAYFATTTRAWEFAFGAAAAIWMAPPADRQRFTLRRVPTLQPTAAAVMSWIGLIVLLWSAIALPSAPAFPGWIALVPTLATAFILIGGAHCEGSGIAAFDAHRKSRWRTGWC